MLVSEALHAPGERAVLVDTPLGSIEVTPDQTERFTLPIPANAMGDTGTLVIKLDYPDAISPGPRTANTYWRSVKLTAAALTP